MNKSKIASRAVAAAHNLVDHAYLLFKRRMEYWQRTVTLTRNHVEICVDSPEKMDEAIESMAYGFNRQRHTELVTLRDAIEAANRGAA